MGSLESSRSKDTSSSKVTKGSSGFDLSKHNAKQSGERGSLLERDKMGAKDKTYSNRSYGTESIRKTVNEFKNRVIRGFDKESLKNINKDGLSGQKDKSKEKPIKNRKKQIFTNLVEHAASGAAYGAATGTILWPGIGTATGAVSGTLGGIAGGIVSLGMEEVGRKTREHKLGTEITMRGEYQKLHKESKQSSWISRLGGKIRDQVSRMKREEVLGRPRTKKRDQA